MTSTVTDPTAAYVAAVSVALTGVPELERQELLDDLADHLAELEADDAEGLEAQLGPPELYAAELVASAGIDVGGGARRAPRPPWWQRAGDTGRRALDGPRATAVREFLPELRSGWWVLRAWGVLALLTVWLADDRRMFPVADVFENLFVSTLALLAAVVASVQLGRSGGRWLDRSVTTLGVIGVLVALGQGSPDADDHSGYGYDGSQGFVMMTHDGRVVENIWPFDQDGQPLDGVFLFDQDGVPIDLGEAGGGDPGTVVVPGLFPRPTSAWEYDPATGAERIVPAMPPTVSIPRLPTGATTTSAPTTTTTTTTTTTPGPALPEG